MNKGITFQVYESNGASKGMGWLCIVASIKSYVSFAKEPFEKDNILQKRPLIVSILLTVANP